MPTPTQTGPARIILDARKLGDGGIGVSIENLVDGLLLLKDEGEVDLNLTLLVEEALTAAPEERKKTLRQSVGETRERWEGRVRFVPERAGKYSLAEYLRLAGRQREELRNQDLFHAPHYTLPLFLKIPSVATIHDVIHLTHPSTRYHEPVARTLLRSAVKRATRIVTVSDHSRETILRELPVRPERIAVIGNSVRPGIERRSAKDVAEFLAKEKMESQYCLFVGSEMPHKGFAELIEAWSSLFSDVSPGDYPHLFIVGRTFTDASRKLVQEKGLAEVVRFLGEVSNRRLSLLYSGARALVLPSRAEGFGLPALEAMALGIPVVATPLPSVKEFGEGVVWFASDFEPASFARAVRRALEGASREVLRIEKGKRKGAEFNIRDGARATWRVYQEAMAERAGRSARRDRVLAPGSNG